MPNLRARSTGGKLLSLFLTLTMMLIAAPAGADTHISISVDDYDIPVQPAPFIINGRTMVDLKALAMAVGATAEIAADARTGSITHRGTKLNLTAAKAVVGTVGHHEMAVDVAPETRDGRLLVPLRHVLEALGFAVGWNNSTRTVLVNSPAAAGPTMPNPNAQIVELTAQNFKFAPSEITVTRGRPVHFVMLSDTDSHTFTISDLGVDVVVMSGQTGTVEVTFDKAGTYTFICRFHASSMTGRIVVVEPATATGTVRITDGAARSDRASVAVEGAAPGSYDVVFLDNAGADVGTASLVVNDSGAGSVVWNAADQLNIFTRLNKVELRRGGNVVLSATLPGPSHNHIKHVLSGDPDGGPGYAVSMLKQGQGAHQHATLAARGDSIAWVQTHADHVHSYLSGVLTGLRPGNSNPANLDDAKGHGLRRYVTEAARHAGFAAAQEGATDPMKLHNGHVQFAAVNLLGPDGQSGWIGEAVTLAREIVAMNYGDDVAKATADAQRLLILVDRILNGVDMNGNGRVDPTAGEAAVMIAYPHAQFMGWWYLR